MRFTDINTLKQRGHLTTGDSIVINYKGQEYIHELRDSYFHVSGMVNWTLLKQITPDYREKLGEAYGYGAGGGDWPTFKYLDYDAAYRAIIWLWEAAQSGDGETYTTTAFTRALQKGDAVTLKHVELKGVVMAVSAYTATVAWESGDVAPVSISDLILINKTKTQEHEHLQKQNLPVKGGERSSGTGISDRGSGSAVGRGYHGYQASFEDSEPCIRSSKIRGTAVKF